MTERSEEELQAVIDDAREELARRKQAKRQEVIEQIRELAASIDVIVKIDFGVVTPIGVRKGGKVPIKYQNPNNPDEVWSGRGMKPKWLLREVAAGADAESFRIAA